MIRPPGTHPHALHHIQRLPERGNQNPGEITPTELSQLASVTSFVGSTLKVAGGELAEKVDPLGQIFGTAISGRAVISGQALQDIKKEVFAADPSERMKFWNAASSFLSPTSAGLKLIEGSYRESFPLLAASVGHFSSMLHPLEGVVKEQRAAASSLTAFKTLRGMSSRASTRERIINQSGFIEAAGGVAKIAASTLGFPHISLGMSFISNLAGMIKAFSKTSDYAPYQNPLDKELMKIKTEALALVEAQYTDAFKNLEASSFSEKETLIAGLEISLMTRRKEIQEAPDEEVLFRGLIYYDIESHGLFSQQIFSEWKTEAVTALCHQCNELTDKKTKAVQERSSQLADQLQTLSSLMKRLEEAQAELDTKYKEGSVVKEFILQDIQSVKGLLVEEQKKIASLLLEKKQHIEDRPSLPMFESHELTEDLSQRPDITDWLERADEFLSKERKDYLEKKVARVFDEPSLAEIAHI